PALTQMEKSEVKVRMESAYKHLMAGNYEKADEEFRHVLANAPTLPPEICYYFGLNSYYLGKYKQSINWLNKYIELKGTDGQFFESSEKYLDLAEEAFRKERNIAAEGDLANPDSDTHFSNSEDGFTNRKPDEVVDCERLGKVICPVCKGKGVIIKEGLFGREYNTCPYGDNYGYMSCEDYNLLLQGKLEPQQKN